VIFCCDTASNFSSAEPTGNIDVTGDGDTLVQSAFTSTGHMRLQAAAGQLTIVETARGRGWRYQSQHRGHWLDPDWSQLSLPTCCSFQPPPTIAELGSERRCGPRGSQCCLEARFGIGTSANTLNCRRPTLPHRLSRAISASTQPTVSQYPL
jgi:hypothetical protein